MAVRKKQDDKYLLALRELVNSGAGNRQCFDCNQKGPTYVNMTIGSFVCTRCSGVLRGLTPPHRVKSISMATFTQDEIDFLKAHGNELCAKTWLGLWDPKRAAAQQDQRELMIDKYERKRYYLEPASPLKSLNLKSTSSSSSTSTASNGYHTGNISSNGYASIHLTPPAAQRTAANGLSKSAASSTAISRPQHHHHHHQHQNQNHNGNHDGFSHNLAGLGLGLTSLNSAGSTSTGALSDTSSCASNGFAGESDFVADFGSANIFDATSARSTGSPAVSSTSSVSSINGYAKVQPIRAAHLQQQQQQQQQMLNGNSTGSENFADFEHAPIYNGVADAMKSLQTLPDWYDWKTSDYSDPFENEFAALRSTTETSSEAEPESTLPAYSMLTLWSDDSWPEKQSAVRFKSSATSLESVQSAQSAGGTATTTSASSAMCCSSNESLPTPTNPFLPQSKSESAFSRALSALNIAEEAEKTKAIAATAAEHTECDSNANILNAYYNPFFTWSTALQSQQLNQATSKPSPRASNAPSEDRYAALKDLDEQLRELKASEAATVTEAPTPTNGNTQLADAFGTVNGNSSSSNNNNSNNNHVNPFKSQQSLLINGSSHLVNPFQAQQLQQQQLLLQQQQQQQQQNLYGQLTLLPNGYGSSPQQAAAAAAAAAAATSFYNFNNNGFALAQGLPNGCGFGSMQPAPVLAGGLAGGFNNPFAASGAMNTNNPFL
ncbi:hypothetical protein AWZ03_003636 [Drosophila navojoa]|uniref:Arf-GAP domain-containing protein n=1 Tax=Drosophila navojoa TaxID=7232 RepID=A0A484BP85_DRONA|nr:arf-GAP domain and FG repeat-containing protein 1 isoform X1 [Drosophila navojoa]TDG49860.1 hypothetical protein AWZ03_003636 [Drosophila navojoa]